MPKKRIADSAESDVAPRLARTDSAGVITLPLDDDGSVKWDQVRDTTKDKFKKILSDDPTALEMVADALGDLPDDGEEGEGPKITEANVGAIIDKVNTACAFGIALLVGKFKNHPILRDSKTGQPAKMVIAPEVVMRASELTPEQHKELDPRALAVSSKYMDKIPDSVKKNFDLYMLGLMFLQFQAQNMGKMIQTQVALDIRAVTINQAKTAPKPIPPDSDKPNGQATTAPPQDQGGESLEPGHIPPEFPETPRV